MLIDLEKLKRPCSCGKQHQLFVRDVFIEAGAFNRLPELLKKEPYNRFMSPAVICDDNTKAAGGDRVSSLLQNCPCVCLEHENLHADERAVSIVERALPSGTDVLLAVGSGTIHDITRYVAAEKNLPFLSVPTAASVDGFVSTVAAMTWHGFKKSFASVSPLAVIADSEVFSKAPYRLTASGISDLLGKYTALADWKISNLVTGEWLCETICQMEADAIEKVKACIPGLKAGDLGSFETLMYALLLSGLAMQMVGNSRPASGCEHHMSHLWEMEVLNPHTDAYHGEKVSVGLIKACAEYGAIRAAIEKGACEVRPYPGMETEELKLFDRRGLLREVLEENTPDPLLQVEIGRLKDSLPGIAEILRRIPSGEEAAVLLKGAGCVTSMEELGLDESILEKTLVLSPYVRRRLTLMRLKKLLFYAK